MHAKGVRMENIDKPLIHAEGMRLKNTGIFDARRGRPCGESRGTFDERHRLREETNDAM